MSIKAGLQMTGVRQPAICHRFDPDCKVCGKPVYWSSRIFFADRVWHSRCFCCCRCHRPLLSNQNAPTSDADLPIDFDSSKYSRDRKSKASPAILGEDLALRCSVCHQRFELKKHQKHRYRTIKMDNLFSTTFPDYGTCLLEESSMRSDSISPPQFNCSGDTTNVYRRQRTNRSDQGDAKSISSFTKTSTSWSSSSSSSAMIQNSDRNCCGCTGCELYLVKQNKHE